ncbi:MAG TPA: hypothetical protein PLL66_07155 [Bacteroidales bacterium]|nr:hypothetical protein [Bacteroidales bacterium]
MKKIFNLSVIIVIFLLLNSCTNTETISEEKHYSIVLKHSENTNYKMYIHKGAGNYCEILPEDKVYQVDVEPMRGGYTRFLLMEFNKHMPEEYEILRITQGSEVVKEFSIKTIENLPKDDNLNYIMVID